MFVGESVWQIAGAVRQINRLTGSRPGRTLDREGEVDALARFRKVASMDDRVKTESDSFRFLTRRRVLKLGLAGVGALAAGGVGGIVAIRGHAPQVDGLLVLSNHEYRTLTAIAHTLIPQGGAFPLGAADFDLARDYDTFLADEPAENIKLFKRALDLVEYGPLVFERKLTTFSNLDSEARLAHWQNWETSDELLRRQVTLAFRRFLSIMFYDKPAVWPYIHYPKPFFADVEA